MEKIDLQLTEKDILILKNLIERTRKEFIKLYEISGVEYYLKRSQASDIDIIVNAFGELSYSLCQDTASQELYRISFCDYESK